MEEAKPVNTTATTDRWSRVAFFLLVGYCLMGRSFAYLGLPPWHLFIAEIVLAAFLFASPVTIMGPWVSLARRLRRLQRLSKFYLILVLYGVFQVFRGIALGHPPLIALRDLAFDYYPLFFLLGLWFGFRKPNFSRLFRLLAWFNAVYGVAYILFLDRVSWNFPGVSDQLTPVPIFGLPGFSFVVLLGLLSYEPDLKKVWHLLVLNVFVMLGMQIRAEWFGLAVGLFVWACVTRKVKRLFVGAAAVTVVLAIMLAVNFRLPGPESRGGGEISARDLVGRALAPVDPMLAEDYTSSARMDVATTVWRTVWWAAIWNAVNHSRSTALLGFGYGYPIGDLVPYLQGDFIQTPHNAFFYALGYTGWIGVVIFALFQAELARVLWRVYRKTGRPVGVVLWAAMIALSMFEPFFETPQGAVPFYLLLGAIVGAAMSRPRSARPILPQPMQPATNGA